MWESDFSLFVGQCFVHDSETRNQNRRFESSLLFGKKFFRNISSNFLWNILNLDYNCFICDYNGSADGVRKSREDRGRHVCLDVWAEWMLTTSVVGSEYDKRENLKINPLYFLPPFLFLLFFLSLWMDFEYTFFLVEGTKPTNPS